MASLPLSGSSWSNGRGSTATNHRDSESGLLIICRGLHDLVSPPKIFLQCKILLSYEALGILGSGHVNGLSYCL